MNTGPIDNDNSPLDEILDNLPQEKPPVDLQQRCMSAVRAAEAKRVPATPMPWSGWMRAVAGVLGVLLFVVIFGGAFVGLMNPKKSEPPPPPPIGMPSMSPRGADAEKPGMDSRTLEAPPPPGIPGPAPGAKGPEALRPGGMGTPQGTVAMKRPVPPEAAKTDSESARQTPPSPPATPATPSPTTPPPASMPSGGSHSWRRPVAPEQPWRDETDDRQKITHKRMELEVKKVEEAHDRAINIINKSDGHTTTEDLQIRETGKNRSHIVAQIPVDRLEGTMAQLRELGKVKLLTGESEDVSKEYYGRGEDIREAGAGEDELVAKYEAEKDPATKRQLLSQIQALRAQNKQGKRTLGDLSEKTHYAVLDLMLTEAASPGAFFNRMVENSTEVAGWLLYTAIMWVPVVVIAWLVWRRRRP